MELGGVRILAAVMATVHAIVWVTWSRWEGPGRDAELRATIRPSALVKWGGDLSQIVPLLYPLVVLAAPGWTYEGPLNWESRIDGALLWTGVGLWIAGVSVLMWSAKVLGPHAATDGLAVDHELVTAGPYRYVRHPIYTASSAVAVGTALAFRSYILVGVAIVWMAAAAWWARSEEELMASRGGFGERYRTYLEQTGRFVPRMRNARPDGARPDGG